RASDRSSQPVELRRLRRCQSQSSHFPLGTWSSSRSAADVYATTPRLRRLSVTGAPSFQGPVMVTPASPETTASRRLTRLRAATRVETGLDNVRDRCQYLPNCHTLAAWRRAAMDGCRTGEVLLNGYGRSGWGVRTGRRGARRAIKGAALFRDEL